MLALHDFLQATPAPLLHDYFLHRRHQVVGVDWNATSKQRAAQLLRWLDELPAEQRRRVQDDAEHLAVLARDDGQEALYSVQRDTSQLDRLANGFARATWVFINDPQWWEHAEQIRYSDERRFGRAWDGYVVAKNLTFDRRPESKAAFERRVAEALKSANVEAEVCDRSRSHTGGSRTALIQISIFFEGRRGDRRAFVSGQLDRVPDLPVLEAAIAYTPASGALEVVANTQQTRDTLVRLFAETMLGAVVTGERLPIRQYSIDHLRAQQRFAWDAGDGIEEVAVTLLRLMPLDATGERITLECMRSAARTIWDMANERFGENNPLLGGHRVTQARLRIRFAPQARGRGRRTFPVLITMPNGCDLKARTSRERLIGEKYFERWGIVRDV